MGTDIKLKDLFGQTQTEQDISTVSVPKADGTGREFYVKRPVIYYRLVDSPHYAPQEGDSTIIFWNLGDGGLDYADMGNSLGRYHEAVDGKTTKPIVYVTASKYLEGISADNSGYAQLIYLEEAVPGQTLIDILFGVTGTADFTAQPGWGQLIQGADGQTYTYTQLTDLSGIAIGIEQPNNILSRRLFFSYLTEKTNSAVAYIATKNGDYTIVPPAENSGISAVNLTVDVAGGSGGETEEVTVDLSMADGDQVIMPSAGKSISKATVTKPSTLIPANIKKDVVIGGVTGTLDSGGGGVDNFITQAFSDDDILCDNGFGVARTREHGIEIQIWADASSNITLLDEGYQYYFSEGTSWGNISNTSLANRLEAFCSNIVTNNNTIFSTLFEGATKACFMDDEHPVPIPTLSSSTAATTEGFMIALESTLADLPPSALDGYGFMDPNDYGENLANSIPTQGSKAIMPFIWYPAVEDGDPVVAYYNLQDPTGTMTTYENGFKMYNLSVMGKSITLGYVNAVPAIGVTSNFIALVGEGGIWWWSDAAQTIPAAFLQNMNPTWTGGDVSLVAGWNMTIDVGAGTNTTVQMPEAVKTSLPIEPNSIPLSEMDSYEKSIFYGVTRQPYKRLNQNHVSITFVLRNNTQL